jgi:hypothetical protein
MRRGSFEQDDYTGGQKIYRLRWDNKQYVLTSKEVLSGLFIRYLISRGKLSENCSNSDLSPAEVSPVAVDQL